MSNNITGIITETLPNLMFKVKLDSNNEIVASTTTKLRLRKVKLLVGDRVLVRCYENISRIILKYKL
ncbi:Translation initiation factor IF-1 [Candidatus Hodgkinia cicadicola]|uniref:Translation initiation factor IF-1 n=1 Tax=Candidatus Hodgkinia cicadicola TaxID=573658 RepID=A0ABX4MG28_9HYPH|nr:Translation initiation factor IF-1 [Candidatus Hodgkinia cicadicola]PIM95597.1 Translation initiation factor IF-1 [Candidatus Hodgkinia cicadicola]